MSETAGTPAPKPQRPPAEIVAELEKERAGLNDSFAVLRDDLDAAVDAGVERAREVGHKAALVAPIAVALLAAAGAASLLRRRRRS